VIERRTYGPDVNGGAHKVLTVECSACGARFGEDYHCFSKHLFNEHGPEDFCLAPLGEIRAADGSTEVVALAE
jgi:hypothetical protein